MMLLSISWIVTLERSSVGATKLDGLAKMKRTTTDGVTASELSAVCVYNRLENSRTVTTLKRGLN